MQFSITESVYDEFKTYLTDKEYVYTTRTEKDIEDLEKQAKKDNYFDLLSAEIERLNIAMANTKNNDLANHKEELKEILEYEIIKRYYFERGRVEISFDNDPDWEKVTELLSDNAKYSKLIGT